jgi:hypothetical protein
MENGRAKIRSIWHNSPASIFKKIRLFSEAHVMPKFLIERNIPGAGQLSPEQLQGISQKSCSVLRELGPQIQWIQSYVTEDKITCVYIAPSADLIYEHAKQSGFPADAVLEIKTIIDPTTSEG